MEKIKVIERIIKSWIIAVVRAESPDQALKVAESVKKWWNRSN